MFSRAARAGLLPGLVVVGVLLAAFVAPATASKLGALSLNGACYGYACGPPTVTGVSPTGGPTTGGTVVTITGTFFSGDSATVHFGATAATSVTVVDDSHIQATSPAHAAGTVDVTVTTTSGTSATSAADQFTYATPTPCTSAGDSPSPASPHMTIGTATFTFSAGGCPSAEYALWIKSPGASLYALVRNYSSSNTFTWYLGSNGAGTYAITVWVRDAGHLGIHSNFWGNWDAYNYQTYTLTPGCSSAGDSAVPASPQVHGTPITFNFSAVGCPTPQYALWIKSPGAKLYTLVTNYSTTASFTWLTASDGAGTYAIVVWVRDASHLGVNHNFWGNWDVYNYQTFKLT